MSQKPCCMCNQVKSGMTYTSKAFCGPCRDVAIEFYLKHGV
jgi:hypothetical protein